jgi:spermidine/putrescine transport system ATP-binding protein
MTMSDRIAVMNAGRYEQLGDPETLYEHPATRFTAAFLGVSNLLGGECQGTADGLGIIQLADGTVVRAPADAVYGRTTVDVGVRPEKIRLHHDGADVPAGHNRLEGVVADASYLGVSTQYIVETRGGASVTVYEQNIERTTKEELWSRGSHVHLSWIPDHTFVVEAAAPGAVAVAAE